jgi:hypothetical protein
MTMSDMTVAELALVQILGQCVEAFVALCDVDFDPRREYAALGDDERATRLAVRSGDIAEFVAHVHDLQHAVMARAARRAHPDAFPHRQPIGDRR